MAGLLYAVFLLGWMSVIFLLSSQTYEKQDVRPWLGKALARFRLEERLSGIRFDYGGREVSIRALGVDGFAEFFLRKAAHVAEYAILGCLLLLALRAAFGGRRRWAPAAALASLAFALGDEYHQSFVKGRTPLAQDVAVDVCGACVGIAAGLLAFRVRRGIPKRAGRTKEKTG